LLDEEIDSEHHDEIPGPTTAQLPDPSDIIGSPSSPTTPSGPPDTGDDRVRGRRDHVRANGGSAAALAAGLERTAASVAGDVVGLRAYNCPGSWKPSSPPTTSGRRRPLPINWRLGSPEVRYILEHSRARVAGLRPRALGRLGTGATRHRALRCCGRAVDHCPDGWAAFETSTCSRVTSAPVRVAADDVHRLMYNIGAPRAPQGS